MRLATESGLRLLAPEPRPATNTEPRLQGLVFFPVLSRCPEEQATDKNGRQEEH
jgi:hypothetical protein